MLQNPKTTSKKFYNKFIYKVSLKLPGAHALRQLSYDQIINFIAVPPPHSHFQPVPNRGYMDWRVKLGNTIHNNGKTWSKIISLFSGVPKKDLSFRVEAWVIENKNFVDNQLRKYSCQQSERCAELVIRLELSKAQGRLKREKEKQKKDNSED